MLEDRVTKKDILEGNVIFVVKARSYSLRKDGTRSHAGPFPSNVVLGPYETYDEANGVAALHNQEETPWCGYITEYYVAYRKKPQ